MKNEHTKERLKLIKFYTKKNVDRAKIARKLNCSYNLVKWYQLTYKIKYPVI